MSVERSISYDSTSSSATMSKNEPNEATLDPSNILYNDRRNYQVIFSNDSRFFDTSLHLFKSYCDLGYVKFDNKKSKKNLRPSSSATFKPQTNGFNIRWRSKQIGFSSNPDANGNPNGTLKLPFGRHYDHSISHRSDPGMSKLITSKMKQENSLLMNSSQRQSMPSSNHSLTNDDDSDDPDIIVTRL